jgi:hypothetical protein
MSCTNDDVKNHEPAPPDEPTWWQEVFRILEVDEGAEPLSETDSAALFPAVPSVETGDSVPTLAESFQPTGGEGGGAAPSRRGSPSRDRKIYTLERVNEIGAALRALPARDPSERRLHKQMVIRQLVEEITALQNKGYTLEQVATLLRTEGVEVTTPTLKSYLSRVRKASGKGARKASPRATLPLVLTRGAR